MSKEIVHFINKMACKETLIYRKKGNNVMEIIKINNGWNFLLDNQATAHEHSYWQKEYKDDLWETVTLPHDWSVAHPFSKKHSSGTGYLPGGIAWYRIRFNLPERMKGQKIWIVFDGVYKNSQVWCNSYYMGKWPCGYTSFRYDITDQVCFGEAYNVVAVKVSHTDIADSRWFTGSGITRKVTIVTGDYVHIEPDSLFFTTTSVETKSAKVAIEMNMVNETHQKVKVVIESRLVDQKGTIAMVMKSSQEIESNNKHTIKMSNTIKVPTLWSAKEPNLYKLVTVMIQEGKEQIIDERAVGIRECTFDANRGFFVNGENTLLKGVCVHHDAGCLGAAVQTNIWERRLEKLKLMGCNAIRGSHNPHMPELYDLCDQMGFYVIDEAFDEWEGPKNKWATGHNVYPPKHQGYYEEFPQWHKRDLQAMITRDRNHPSVIMWSIGNEIDYPNDPYCHPSFGEMTGNNDANKPIQERQYNLDKPNAERLVLLTKELMHIAKEVDQTRPITMAIAYPELSTKIGIVGQLDVVGYNYKEEHYTRDHKRFPNKPFFGSENSNTYEAWLAVKENAYISGQFLWTGIDFLGEAQGWPIHGSEAGLMTMAGFEKNGYYFRQSLWSATPMVKLMTGDEEMVHRHDGMSPTWHYTKKEKITVRAYTNLDQAELFSNNKSLGIADYDDKTGYIEWLVDYESGKLEVKAKNKTGNETASDCIKTSFTSRIIELIPWDQDYRASGVDLVQVEVAVKDSEGNLGYHDSTKLFVDVEGAEIIGIENGDVSDVTEYTANYRRAYHGKMVIYIRLKSEHSVLKVHGKGLKISEIEL